MRKTGAYRSNGLVQPDPSVEARLDGNPQARRAMVAQAESFVRRCWSRLDGIPFRAARVIGSLACDHVRGSASPTTAPLRRPQTRRWLRLAQVTENRLDRRRFGDEGDDPRRATAPGTQQRQHLVDADQQQRPDIAGCLAMRRLGGRVGRWHDRWRRDWNRQAQERRHRLAAPALRRCDADVCAAAESKMHFLNGFDSAGRKFHFRADWQRFGGRWRAAFSIQVSPRRRVRSNASAARPRYSIRTTARAWRWSRTAAWSWQSA